MSNINEKFLEIYKNIQNHLKFISNEKIINIEQLNEQKEFYAISMSIFSILNNLIELGEELIDFLDLEIPVRYRDIPKILLNNKIISDNEFKTFDKLIRYRNNIAHEYDLNITKEDLFWCIKNLNFVKTMMKISKKLVFE